MKKETIKTIIVIIFMSPFLMMSITGFIIPILSDLTIRTTVLFYIFASINNLIALLMGFMFVVTTKKNK